MVLEVVFSEEVFSTFSTEDWRFLVVDTSLVAVQVGAGGESPVTHEAVVGLGLEHVQRARRHRAHRFPENTAETDNIDTENHSYLLDEKIDKFYLGKHRNTPFI